jgi:hypothetical protein
VLISDGDRGCHSGEAPEGGALSPRAAGDLVAFFKPSREKRFRFASTNTTTHGPRPSG